MATKIIETKKLASGVTIRLQQRGQKFDVIRNSTGYAWHYVAKAVTESAARDQFFLLGL